jgi:carbonic anhydrase
MPKPITIGPRATYGYTDELKAAEVAVIGHHGCGMTGLSADRVLGLAKQRGVSGHVLDTLHHSGIDLQSWLTGFSDVETGVRQSVDMIRNHPLLPRDVPVHGLIMDPATGKLDLLVDGYALRA